MKQFDIFGKEIDLNQKQSKRKIRYGGRIPIKSMFRFINGYRLNYYCKNCIYFEKKGKFHKCSKIGITASSATDIRVNDIACHLYEEKRIDD